MGWQRCPLCGVFGELDACLGLFEACVCARESPVASALLYLVGVQKSSCKLGARVAVWSPSRLARGCVFLIYAWESRKLHFKMEVRTV